jgi:hypothetical protein
MPRSIRSLGPGFVSVYRDVVTIELGGGFHHFGLLAYADGQEGEGDRKVADGLWFYEER